MITDADEPGLTATLIALVAFKDNNVENVPVRYPAVCVAVVKIPN